MFERVNYSLLRVDCISGRYMKVTGRYGKMTISGRKDAKSGNLVFHYHPDTHTFKTIDQCVMSPL